MSSREAFSNYLARMAAIGFRPSSALGQNFLLDPTLHAWIAEQAGPTPADTVVEIGVGLGFLTRELAARAGRVLGIEIDARLLQLTRADLAGHGNIEWVEADALSGPGRTLLPVVADAARAAAARGGRLLVVANLPYSVSGPLLAELCALDPLPARAVVLVQKEMASRVAAASGSADFGALSVQVQAAFVARLLRDVPPDVFRPRPKVVSALLQLDRRPPGALLLSTGDERRRFGVFVRELFRQRRKVLRHTLPAAAAAAGVVPPNLAAEVLAQRAEQLDAGVLLEWWRACTPGRPA
ncbi:MAG: ribosomal RNA small subunit methyltransferase A [Planctomycetes bacterium]|nr:ribosomal RNA small subunit methyltransferase A [Planctomycetota bacterium]